MLLIADNYRGFSGYAKAVRELAYAMSKLTDVKLLDIDVKGYTPEFLNTIETVDASKLSKDDFILIRPYFDDPFKFNTQARIIANVVLESSIPEKMVVQCNDNRVHQVWVPSDFVRRLCLRAGIIEDKLRIVPHGFNPNTFFIEGNEPKYDFVFAGGYMGLGDRKGADILAKAFTLEFNPGESSLLFKINPAYGTNLHDLRLSPDIKIEDHKLIDEGMRKVYNSGKCFINPSLAEGFNMTLLEAMACGLDIISTVNGGQMEYLTKISSEDRGYLLLHGDVIPAKYTMWDTSKWVRPNMEELRQTMRMFYDRKTTFAKRTHKNIEEFTWDNAAKKATACLEE